MITIKSLKYFLSISLIALCITPASAADWYVYAGATGSASGSDWTNAYTSLPSTLVRGDTYYIADGSYDGYIFDDVNSGAILIRIKKATIADHGTNTGWIDTYGDGQAIFGGWEIYTDYYVFDGQRRNVNWQTGAISEYGIRVKVSSGKAIRLDNGGESGGDNLIFRYIDVEGGGRDTGDFDSDVIYGLNDNSNITFQNCALHDSDRTIFLTRGTPNNWLIEYNYIARNASSPTNHGEIHSSTSSTNWTWRYNIIEDPEGTAVWAFLNNGTATNWFIYGNVIYHSSSYDREGISGLIFVADDVSQSNTLNGLRFYNNTVWNINGLWSGIVIQSGNDNIVENNIWSQCVQTNHGATTVDYNTYYQTTSSGDDGLNSQTVGTQPIINPSAKNFGLLAATTAGLTLPFPYNFDPLGIQRGADSNWDRGVYEYNSATSIDSTLTEAPTAFKLFQNYPNPFNPSTKISWQSTVGSWQTLKVYDVLGREVATLVNEEKPAGIYEIEFNASELSSGIYFYKLQTHDFSETKKMILIR